MVKQSLSQILFSVIVSVVQALAMNHGYHIQLGLVNELLDGVR